MPWDVFISHASEDKQRRDGIEKKNNLDSMIYQAEKQLQESADKLSDDQKQSLECVVAEAKTDLVSDDAARIDAAFQRVQAELHKVAETLYKSEAAATEGAEPGGPGGPGGEGAGTDDDDVIDAEYTEEKREEG